MTGATPLGGILSPADSDPLADVYNYIRQILTKLDTLAMRKPADEIVNNLAIPQVDDHFAFNAVAGKTYIGEMFLIYTTVNSAIDVKIGFQFPVGVFSYALTGMDPAVASGGIGSGNWNAVSSAVSTTGHLAAGVAGGETFVKVTFTFACTTSGTVRFMWGQNTATASNLTLKAGSHMKVQVI